jgi:hypothetical protein
MQVTDALRHSVPRERGVSVGDSGGNERADESHSQGIREGKF